MASWAAKLFSINRICTLLALTRTGLVVLIAGGGEGIAQRHGVHTVDGNLMFCDEIALDRFGQTLGALDADAAGCWGVRLNFQDVALWPVTAGRQIVQLLLAAAERIGWPLRKVTSASVTWRYWSRPLTVVFNWSTWCAGALRGVAWPCCAC